MIIETSGHVKAYPQLVDMLHVAELEGRPHLVAYKLELFGVLHLYFAFDVLSMQVCLELYPLQNCICFLLILAPNTVIIGIIQT